MLAKGLFFLFLLVFPALGRAQTCYHYPCVIRKIKEALAAKEYQLAFENLESAAAYPDSRPEELSDLRQQLFTSIQQEKEQAESERQRAEEAENRVRSTLKTVQEERDRSEALRKIAERNSEVSRLTARALETEPTDPTLAARLADYAYKHSERTNPLAAKLRRNIFQDSRLDLYTFECVGHTQAITDVAFSPDGKYLLTGSDDGTAKLWDRRGRELQAFAGHWEPLLKVGFSSDGKTVLTMDRHILRFWNLEGEELPGLEKLRVEENLLIDLDAHAQRILTVTPDNLIKFWDFQAQILDSIQLESSVYELNFSSTHLWVRTAQASSIFNKQGKLIRTFDQAERPELVAFSPNGRHLWQYREGRIERLDLNFPDEPPESWQHPELQAIIALDIAADGQLITTVDQAGVGRIWNRQGQAIHQFTPVLTDLEKDMYRNAKITALALSPDGQWALSGNDRGKAKLWRLQPQEAQTFGGHQKLVWSVAMAPGGKRILSGSEDGTVKLWNRSGQELQSLPIDGSPVLSVAFSPDSQYLLAGSEKGVAKVWDAEGGEMATYVHGDQPIRSIAVSPDGQQLATAGGDEIKLWNLSGEATVKLVKDISNAAVGQNICSIMYAPNGRELLLTNESGPVQIIDLDGTLLLELAAVNDFAWDAVFSPDGQQILTANSSGTLSLWNREGEIVQTFTGHEADVFSAAFSTDGKRILSGSFDQSVRLWNLEGEEILRMNGHASRIRSVSFAPPCKDCPKDYFELHMLSAGDDHTIKGWADNGVEMLQFGAHSRPINSLAWSSDQRLIVSGSSDGSAKLWDDNGHLLQQFDGHEQGINAVAFSPDDQLILTGSDDGSAKLWRTDGTLLRTFSGDQKGINAVVFSPDGQQVLTGAYDETAILWAIDGQQIQQFYSPGSEVQAVAFSPDGQLMFIGGTNSAVVWNQRGEPVTRIDLGRGVTAAAFAPHGQSILVGTGEVNGEVKLIDLEGREIRQFIHEGPVAAVAFTRPCASCPNAPDQLILTAGSGQTRGSGAIRVWDPAGNEIQQISVPGGRVNTAVFSVDGNWVLGAGSDAVISRWESIEHFFSTYQELTYVQREQNQLPFDLQGSGNPSDILQYARMQMALPHLQANDPAKSEPFYDQAQLALEYLSTVWGPVYRPYLVQFYKEYGAYAFVKQQFSKAATLFQQALENDPTQLELNVKIALAWVYGGEWEQAKVLIPKLKEMYAFPTASSHLGAMFLYELEESAFSKKVVPAEPGLIDKAKALVF